MKAMNLQSQRKRKLRSRYSVLFLVLLVVEVLIALFVHDSFVRPYLGDVLVVIALYFLVRIFIPVKYKLMPLYIFIFSAAVEFSQYFNILKLLGLEHNTFMRIVMGSMFDFKDILCYAAGCLLLAVYELVRKK